MKLLWSKLLIITLIIGLAGCSSNKSNTLELPDASTINKIELIKNNEIIKVIEIEEEIAHLINHLYEYSTDTNKDSVNDQPTNVTEYFTLNFLYNIPMDNPYTIYLYRHKKKVYIEQPYAGIWHVMNETYTLITE